MLAFFRTNMFGEGLKKLLFPLPTLQIISVNDNPTNEVKT